MKFDDSCCDGGPSDEEAFEPNTCVTTALGCMSIITVVREVIVTTMKVEE